MPEKLFECLSRMDDDAVVNICDKDKTIHITDTFREMKVSDINDILGHDILEIQFNPKAQKLKQMQALSLESKIIMSRQRIKEWHEHYEGAVYVSFSGGVDSTVLLHLVRSVFPDVKAVFCNTGLEYPQIVRFVHRTENVDIIRPKLTFKQVIEKFGYPIISKETASKIHEIRTTKSQKLLDLRLGKTEGRKLAGLPQKYKYLLNAPFKISGECCSVLKSSRLRPTIRTITCLRMSG